MQQLVQQFLRDIHQSTWLELVAVIFGILSVIYSRRENILVYPVGMVSTGIFIYLYIVHGLYADASVNFYYTVMSIIGWYMWSKKNGRVLTENLPAARNPSGQPSAANRRLPEETALKITASSKKDRKATALFFFVCWLVLYLLLKNFTDSTVPVADSFTSAAAFTGMWLMNRKKLENWTWWIITDFVSIPLNFYKHLIFAGFQYLVFLILAVMGYITWRKKIRNASV